MNASLLLALFACGSTSDPQASDPDGTESCSEQDWYFDFDGDGYGAGQPASACDAPDGHVADGGDCNDNDAAIFPGAVEVCNAADDDCDGEVDVGATDVSTWYEDGDGDGFGVDDATVAACDPGDGWAEQAGDCDDDDDGVRPDAVEICGDGVDDDCDGADLSCPRSGEFLVEDADGRLTSDDVATYLGQELAEAGDPEDDGVPGFYVTANKEARVLYYNGWVVGDYAEGASAVIESTAIESDFHGIDGDHDLDGDGVEDLVLGSPWVEGHAGRVHLFYGPITGHHTVEDADAVIANPTTTAFLGEELNVLDVDGDGVVELLVSEKHTGLIYVFEEPTGDVSTEDHDFVITASLDQGSSSIVFDSGDLDGDGVDDLALSHHDLAYVFWGGLDADASTDDADLRIVATGTTQQTILSGSAASDLDNDGRNDLVFGMPHFAGYQGKVAIFTSLSGDAHKTDADVFINGYLSARLGYELSVDADLDGNGVRDLVVGAPQTEPGGELYVWYGPFTSGSYTHLDADLSVSFDSTAGTGWLGGAIAAPGDLDLDGFDDILFSASLTQSQHGEVYLWRGGE